MGTEIERKFLVSGDEWRLSVEASREIRQGYLSRDPKRTVRVRRSGDEAFLTVKFGESPLGRLEFEYPIPNDDADCMLEALCLGTVVNKTRHLVRAADGHVWEIDEFRSPMPGLILAEVELVHRDEAFWRPAWARQEVTEDPRYMNSNIAGA